MNNTEVKITPSNTLLEIWNLSVRPTYAPHSVNLKDPPTATLKDQKGNTTPHRSNQLVILLPLFKFRLVIPVLFFQLFFRGQLKPARTSKAWKSLLTQCFEKTKNPKTAPQKSPNSIVIEIQIYHYAFNVPRQTWKWKKKELDSYDGKFVGKRFKIFFKE